MYVTPILGDFLDTYPLVSAQTLFVDRVVNLMDEGLDIAIRIGAPPDSSLTAVRAGEVRRVMTASPSYLEKHGAPKHPTDLSKHRLIQSMTMETSPDWPFEENGKPLPVKMRPRLRMNTNDAVIELCVRGWRLSRLLSCQIAPYLADGRSQAVLGAFELPPLPIHVVHPEGRMVSGKTRAFVDYMVERLRADPALN